ncbi:MAG: hypothetical protein JO205_02555 [Pseudolabrys sp.]|nr:hypothetical protein [Pseudolabrys sp.]MBV9260231.1 hypothetical protein [Pseudolabrys sp.]
MASGSGWRILGGLAALVALAGCGTVGFDAASYQSAVQLKYETLTLVDQSSGRYNKTAAESLLAKYAAAVDAPAKSGPNAAIADQWAAIRDPGGVSAGNLIQTWKTKGPIPPARRAERKRMIAAHFDRLICLESNRQSGESCDNVGSGAEAPISPIIDTPRAAAKPAPKRNAKPAAEPPGDEPEMETEPQPADAAKPAR